MGDANDSAPLRAVVIGSGIGGAAATALLAHAGIPTVLLEKNRRIGGSCSGYEKQGFKIDIGTHMFCRGPKGPLGDVLRRVGREGAIEFRRTRDIAEMRFAAHGVTLKGADPDGVTRIPVPAELHRVPAFVAKLARVLDLSPREAANAARLFARILTMSDAEVESWNDKTVEDFVRPYTDHGPTVGLFGFLLGLYFILPYWEVSAGEAIWSFQRMVRDNWLSYPVGGSIAIPGAYVKIAEELGAEVRTGVGAKKIVARDGRVRGVQLSDGTLIPARIVVSTSSVRTTVKHLVGEEHFPEEYARWATSLKGSHIAVQAKIGLKKKLVSAGSIVGGVGETGGLLNLSTGDMKQMFDAILDGRVPPVVPLYCPVPTNFDPTLAPDGHQLLTVCSVAPTSDIVLRDPSHAWEEAMLRTLRRVVPGIDESALFIDKFSVDFIENWIGKEFGPAVSTGQTPGQVGPKRPPVYTPLRGLYMAGCGAGARGVGTELAAASAMECVDRILVDLGRDLRVQARPSAAQQAARFIARAAAAPISWAARV